MAGKSAPDRHCGRVLSPDQEPKISDKQGEFSFEPCKNGELSDGNEASKNEAAPAHSAPVQRSDSGRAEGEAIKGASRGRRQRLGVRDETGSPMGYMCDWFAPVARVIWERTGDDNFGHPRIRQCDVRARRPCFWMAIQQVA